MKKTLKILTLVMLIITLIKIGETYAKYLATATTETLEQKVGQWVIKVNEMDIFKAEGDSVEFPLTQINNFATSNAATDKIAPGSEGYTEIVIDPTSTEVAVRYDITLELTGVSDLAISARLETANGENTLVKTGENTYTGIIALSDVQSGEKASVRCYLKWEDLNNDATNEKDSTAGSTVDLNLQLKANVTVLQYLGEEITPYVAPVTP